MIKYMAVIVFGIINSSIVIVEFKRRKFKNKPWEVAVKHKVIGEYCYKILKRVNYLIWRSSADGPFLLCSQSVWCTGKTGSESRVLGGQTWSLRGNIPANYCRTRTKVYTCKLINSRNSKVLSECGNNAISETQISKKVIFKENPKWRIYKGKFFFYQIGPL